MSKESEGWQHRGDVPVRVPLGLKSSPSRVTHLVLTSLWKASAFAVAESCKCTSLEQACASHMESLPDHYVSCQRRCLSREACAASGDQTGSSCSALQQYSCCNLPYFCSSHVHAPHRSLPCTQWRITASKVDDRGSPYRRRHCQRRISSRPPDLRQTLRAPAPARPSPCLSWPLLTEPPRMPSAH